MKSSRPPHPCLWNYFIEFCSFFGDWARFDEAGLSENVICTENGLKIHKGKAHKEVPSPEKLRKPSTQPSLIVSPTRNGNRVEPCHNCDLDMSPSHLCQDDEDSEADEVTEAPIVCGCGCGAPERCPCHFEVMESRKQMLSFILDQTKQFNQFNFKWP